MVVLELNLAAGLETVSIQHTFKLRSLMLGCGVLLLLAAAAFHRTTIRFFSRRFKPGRIISFERQLRN
jgi:hypothetical protein